MDVTLVRGYRDDEAAAGTELLHRFTSADCHSERS